MATCATYTEPIYQAVVSNLALENIRREEAEREQEKFLAKAFECVALGQQVIRVFSEKVDFSVPPSSPAVMSAVQVALCVLVHASRHAVQSTRTDYLPHVSEKYRIALASILDDMASIVDRFEEIAEAWSIASNTELVGEIKAALSQPRNENDVRVSDWRAVLAEVSD